MKYSIQSFRRILLCVLPVISSCAPSNADKLGMIYTGSGDEIQQRQAVIDETVIAIRNRDFSKLNDMELEYRSKRSLTSSGTWKLYEYYSALKGELSEDSHTGSCRFKGDPFLSEWEQFDLRAPAPMIIRARLMIVYAWCQRGFGYSNSVSISNAEKFRITLQQASSILETKRAYASVDPEFYPVMGEIYFGLGQVDSNVEKLFEEGIAREPYYYSIYLQGYARHMPKWGGSAGDVEQFAQHAAKITRSGVGMSTYARLYWYMMECQCGDNNETSNMDWNKVKEGMNDIFLKYPTDWNASNFAQFSCWNNDKVEAAKYFGKIKKNFLQAWSSSTEFESCKRFSTE